MQEVHSLKAECAEQGELRGRVSTCKKFEARATDLSHLHEDLASLNDLIDQCSKAAVSRDDVLQDLCTLHELANSVAADSTSFDIKDRYGRPVYLPKFIAYETQQRAAVAEPFAALQRACSRRT